MSNNSKNIISHFQHWLNDRQGQTFLNYAYSWGAAVVILGALFKLTHLAGADIMLYIGMGTEVIVFILSAFDSPTPINDQESKQLTDPEIEQQLRTSRKQLCDKISELEVIYEKEIHESSEVLMEISKVRSQTRKMVKNLYNLNILYSNMIHALRHNS